jgi:DNA-directed RNA polymerase specialized sigma24 family protein
MRGPPGLATTPTRHHASGGEHSSEGDTAATMLSIVDDHEPQPSFEALFHREFTNIARTVFLIVHDRDIAQEVAQDAFVKLLHHWPKVSSYDRPDAWVRRVAIRIAVRHARREIRRPTVEAGLGEMRAVGLPDPDVARALGCLTAMQRACVVLFYWDDRPVAEISALVGASESTVKQHLHRARTRLRELLADEVDDATR